MGNDICTCFKDSFICCFPHTSPFILAHRCPYHHLFFFPFCDDAVLSQQCSLFVVFISVQLQDASKRVVNVLKLNCMEKKVAVTAFWNRVVYLYKNV